MDLLPGELTQLRADFGALRTDTVTIQRATRASNGAGGKTITWATIATVKASIAAASRVASEPLIADVPAGVQAWTIKFVALVDVTRKDRIVCGARTFEVQAVAGRRTLELSTVVTAIEVT